MKKFILSIMALCSAAIVSAQTTEVVTATLQSGDVTTVYYGIDALKTAVTNAQDGSIITLSSGTFNVPANIDKSVKIYGAGMEDDETTGISRTYLNGGITMNGAYGDQIDNLYLEGLRINGDINVNKPTGDELMEGLKVVKCRANNINVRINSTNIILRQSVCANIHGNSTTATGMMIQNCVVGGSLRDFDRTTSAVVVDHSLLSFDYNGSSTSGAQHHGYYYKNSIINYYVEGGTGAVITYCVASGEGGRLNPSTNAVSNCYYSSDYTNWETLFADGQANLNYEVTGTTSTPRTWQLRKPTVYVGDDGTQVGPAGGDYPWDIIPSTPRITQSTIASKTVDGKLSISIKAEARPVVE